MKRTTVKLALVLVGAHLLLGAIFLAIEATHGINDRDISFAIALLFYYLNFLPVLALRSMGINPASIVVLLAGIAQWVMLAILVSIGYHVMKRSTGKNSL